MLVPSRCGISGYFISYDGNDTHQNSPVSLVPFFEDYQYRCYIDTTTVGYIAVIFYLVSGYPEPVPWFDANDTAAIFFHKMIPPEVFPQFCLRNIKSDSSYCTMYPDTY